MKPWPPSEWFKPKAPTARLNEPQEQEWREAEALWLARKQAGPVPDADVARRLDEAFYEQNGDLRIQGVDWIRINAAERLLSVVLTESQVKSQYSTLYNLARDRRLASLSTYPELPAFVGKTPEERRDIYGALLYELQAGFMAGRFLRRLRNEVADTLWRYGLRVTVAAMLVPLAWTTYIWATISSATAGTAPQHINETIFLLLAVATVAALGAFFSRAMRFQAEISSLSFQAVMEAYIGRMLRLRILYGIIGAVVFYFFLRGEFIAGNIFPKFTPGMITQQTALMLRLATEATVTARPPAEATVVATLSPAVEFAKLLAWSFLAGFSERLVPDALAQLEKKSAEAQTGKPAGT